MNKFSESGKEGLGNKEDLMTQWCGLALKEVEKAVDKPPPELDQEVNKAERYLISIRDTLIDKLREGGMSADQRVRGSLDRINMVLSLIIGAEYPTGGIHRELLDQAGNSLKELLESGWLGSSSD